MKQAFPPALLDKMISHRGLRYGEVLENSLESFRQARALGLRHFETDLQCTKDGRIVLSHDVSLERLYGISHSISELSSEDLAALTMKHGHTIVFLETLLKEFGEERWIFDLKPENGLRTISVLAEMANHLGYRDFLARRVRFLFWDRQQEAIFSKIFPEITKLPGEFSCWRAGLSVLARLPSLGGIQSGKSYAVPYQLKSKVILTQDLVTTYHQRGARVMAYLPPPRSDLWLHFHHIGVDELLVDEWPI